MYGMNFLFGNNFGFGGFGCCCRRPMVNPYMLGVMRGYNSAMIGYAMMGLNFSTPVLNNFTPSYSYPQYFSNNYYTTDSYTPSVPSYSDLNARYEEVSKKWQNALSAKISTQKSNNVEVSNQGTTKVSSVSSTPKKEVKSDADFMYKVQKVARSLNCDTDDLLALMNSESGLKTSAHNKSGSGAVGLIQFTDPAIRELNNHGVKVTKEQLLQMSPTEQLDYVEKYLKIAKSYKFSDDQKLTAGDLYAITFLPGRASNNVLASSGESFYSANKGLDIDGDGKITKSDLAKRLDNFRVSLVA